VKAKSRHLGLAVIVFLCSPGAVLAQSFLTPLDQFAGDAVLVTRDVEKVEGYVRRWKGSRKKGELRRGGGPAISGKSTS
jgi:hypothetical protein